MCHRCDVAAAGSDVGRLWEIRLDRARIRGYRHGWGDAFYSVYRVDPLSGEWSGESVADLLGDLYSDLNPAGNDDDVDALSDLMAAYEQGYEDGHAKGDPSGMIRAKVIRDIYG